MGTLRCCHCGLESEDNVSASHKSTCKPEGRPEDYMIPVGTKTDATSPKKTTNKKSKSSDE